jgi:hypothetical protein
MEFFLVAILSLIMSTLSGFTGFGNLVRHIAVVQLSKVIPCR